MWAIYTWSVFAVIEIEDMIGHTDTKIISDTHLAFLVRQMAVHANVSTRTFLNLSVYKLQIKAFRSVPSCSPSELKLWLTRRFCTSWGRKRFTSQIDSQLQTVLFDIFLKLQLIWRRQCSTETGSHMTCPGFNHYWTIKFLLIRTDSWVFLCECGALPSTSDSCRMFSIL